MKLLWVICLLGLAGCADRDTAYRNMYEGLKKREEITNPTVQSNRSAEPILSYDKYEEERKKLLEKDAEK